MTSLSLSVGLVLATAAAFLIGQGSAIVEPGFVAPDGSGHWYWSNWGSWSSCSQTCGGGRRTRSRYCRGDNLELAPADFRARRAIPVPFSSCRPGQGDSQSQSCGATACPCSSYWSNWSSWSSCSKTCGGGRRRRTRTCRGEVLLAPERLARERRALPFEPSLPSRCCRPWQQTSQSQVCNSFNCTCPICRCPNPNRPGAPLVPCSCQRLDVAAAVDGSGSISPAEFSDMKAALRALLDDLQVAPSGDHVALVLYSSSVTQSFALTGSRSLLDSRVNGLSRPGALTRTHLAISRMADLLLPGRGSVPKVGVVFTDGQSTDKSATLAAAANAKSRGVTLFAVGIGNNLDQAELDAIASCPDLVFRASDFRELRNTVVHRLAAKVNVARAPTA